MNAEYSVSGMPETEYSAFLEYGIFGFRHADGVKKMRIRGHVNGFHVGEGREHHQHFGGFEHLHVVLHVAIVHFHVGLCEEAKDLGQQVLFGGCKLGVPIFHVIGHGHFFRQPVDALLLKPSFVRPGIPKRFISSLFLFKIWHMSTLLG